MELKNGLKMNCCRESYPMEKRTIFKLITTIAIFMSMGGCVKQEEQTKQARKLSPLHQPKKTKKP